MRPRDLPKVRDQVLRHLADPGAAVQYAAHPQTLATVAGHLRAAELYWVAPDMTALAVAAGGRLDGARWATGDRPSGCGLLVFDGGAGAIHQQGVDIPVDAVSWGPLDGECGLTLWLTRHRFVDQAVGGALARQGWRVEEGAIPPLLPLRAATLPVDGMVPLDALPDVFCQSPAVIAAVAAAWLLMFQPLLSDRTRVRAERSVRSAYGRRGEVAPEVTVVDLRRRYVPDLRDPDAETATPGRIYRNRWIVSGHWRDQAVGPKRGERRRIWVAQYVKGPDGAPLLAAERVNVWRR
jgi:hypothetical protein